MLTLGEQGVDGRRGRIRLGLEPAGSGILEQELDRLGRVLLVGADHAGGAALDPAGDVDARARRVRPRSGSCRSPRRTPPPAARRRGSRRCGRRARTRASRARRSGRRARSRRARCGRARFPRLAPRRGSRPASGRSGRRRAAACLRARAQRAPAAPRGCARRSCPCGSAPSRSAGSTITSAPASSPISCSSGVVNAACAGPRRPTTTISRIGELAMAAIEASVASVGASSSWVSASIRATSSATFPFPITTTRSTARSNSSCW